GATLPDLFEAQAERTPDATAVVFKEEQLSYAELNERANRLARSLALRGVGPETRIGLCVERSIDMVVAVLGILKTGGAYVPLDPTLPEQRISCIINDAHLSLVLAHEHLFERIPKSATVVSVRIQEDLPIAENLQPVVVDSSVYV